MKRVLSILLTAVMLFGSLSVLSAVPAFAESARVGAGETKVMVPEKPSGEGTQASPYLISKPEHFYWIQQNTNDPELKDADNASFTTYSDAVTGPSFVGVYFEQTADLDFAGYVFKETREANIAAGAQYKYNASGSESDAMGPIGFYNCDTYDAYGDASKTPNKFYGGFAGNYDGQGYSIKNLKVKHRLGGGNNLNRGMGLFGVIYGATLKNMVLENVDVQSTSSLSGILVGKAYAPTREHNGSAFVAREGSDNFAYNTIENILVNDDCSITDKLADGKLTKEDGSVSITSGEASASKGHYVGGIVGMAVGTTIKNCVTDAQVNVGTNTFGAGGVAGVIGNSVLIDHVISRGAVNFSNLEGLTVVPGGERSFSGMIGVLSSTSLGPNSGATSMMNIAKTGFTVQNCVNAATFNYDTSEISIVTEYWGGIFGGAHTLVYLGSVGAKKYVIKDCYNIVAPGASGIERFAGIGGNVFIANNTAASPLYVENCFSVPVAVSDKYQETNEVISPTDRKTTEGERPVIYVGANNYKKSDGTKLNVASMNKLQTKATLELTEKIWVENAEKTGVTQGDKTFQQVVDAVIATATANLDLTKTGPDLDQVAQVTEKAAKTCDHTAAQHAAAPEGKGTAAEPYLIDSYEDLMWISDGVKDAWDNEQYGINASEGVSTSYTGIYFKQTKDIDLGGKTLTAIGGYYKNTALDSDKDKVSGKEYMSAFGGTYDGNGFKICNGKIAAPTAAGQTAFWSTGLFGVICGATIDDVTLDNITFDYTVGRQFGGIVGQAVTPTSGENAGNPAFNVIKDCVVKSTCSYAVKNSATTAVKLNLADGWANGYYTGGIVGKAQATTISKCTNEANITVPAGTVAAGGIAALVGNGVIIEGCINKGNIIFDGDMTADVSKWMNYADIGTGGIVGYILGNANGMQAHNKLGINGVKIRYSYNSGLLNVTAGSVIKDVDNTDVGMSLQWGGILGGINALPKTEGDLPYIIENCYNITAVKVADIKAAAADGKAAPDIKALRIGGIVGSSYIANNGDNDTLFIKDSLSVSGERNTYNGTNEASIHGNKLGDTTRGSGRAITLLGANAYNDVGAKYAVDGNIQKTYATRELTDFIYENTANGYKLSTTVKLSNLIDLIDAGTIPEEAPTVISPIGVQTSADGSKVRLILGVTGLDYKNFGINGTATGGATGAVFGDAKKAYTSFIANGVTVQASDYGYDYLVFIELIRFKPDIDITYTLKTYATTLGGAKEYGDSMTLNFSNGELVSATVDTMGKYN